MADRIDSAFDPSFFTDFDKALTAIDTLSAKVETASKQQLNIVGNGSPESVQALVNSLNQLNASIVGVTTATKQYKTAQDSVTALEAKLAALDTDKARREAELRALINDKTAAMRNDVKTANDVGGAYGNLSRQYTEAALAAKNYYLALGPQSDVTKKAITDAKGLGDQLMALDASVGQHQRNVGNYSSALTGYANTLRGLRGPTKLLGEALGIGAMEADQFRLVIEHSLQGIAAFFRGKEAKAAATAAETTATNTNTVADGINTVGKEANAVATEEIAVAATTATVATRALNIAMVGLGIGALLALIALCVVAYYDLKDAVLQAKLAHDALAEGLKDSAYHDAIQNVAQLTDHLALAKKGFYDKTAVVNEYNKSIGEAAGKVSDLDGVETGITKHAEAYIKMMLLKATATAAYKLSADQAIKAQQDLADIGQGGDKFIDFITPTALGIQPGITADTRRKKEAIEAQRQADILAKIARDASIKEAEFAKNNGLDASGGGNIQPGSVADLRQRITTLKELIDTETAGSTKQKQDTKELIDLEAQLKAIEGHPTKGHAFDPTSAELKGETDLTKAFYDAAKTRADIEAESQKQIADDDTNNMQKRLDAYEKYSQQRLMAIGFGYSAEYDIADQKLAKIAEIEKKAATARTPEEKKMLFEKEALLQEQNNLTDKYTLAANKITQDAANFQVSMFKQVGKEEEEATKQTQKNLKGLGDFFAGSGDVESLKTHQERQKKQLQEIKDYAAAAETLSGLLKIGSDKRIADLNKEIDLIEKKKNTDIDAVNASLLSQTQKDRKIAEISARAQAQEDAKNEKIKQEKRRQAELDKAIGIAKIIINTAIGATAQFETGPAGFALAAAVIAAGAAELAVAIAMPIPEFRVGTENAPEGVAKVHEGELILPKSGKPRYVSGDTLTYLQAGDVVKTAADTAEIFKYYAIGMPHLRSQNGKEYAMDEIMDGAADKIVSAIDRKRFPSQSAKPAWWQDYYFKKTR